MMNRLKLPTGFFCGHVAQWQLWWGWLKSYRCSAYLERTGWIINGVCRSRCNASIWSASEMIYILQSPNWSRCALHLLWHRLTPMHNSLMLLSYSKKSKPVNVKSMCSAELMSPVGSCHVQWGQFPVFVCSLWTCIIRNCGVWALRSDWKTGKATECRD